jgi:hypothetical protein
MYGHGRLSQTLLEHHLLDEIRFAVHPLLLTGRAAGRRNGQMPPLKLIAATPLASGVAVLSYQPDQSRTGWARRVPSPLDRIGGGNGAAPAGAGSAGLSAEVNRSPVNAYPPPKPRARPFAPWVPTRSAFAPSPLENPAADCRLTGPPTRSRSQARRRPSRSDASIFVNEKQGARHRRDACLSRIAQVGARLHRRRPTRPVPMRCPVGRTGRRSCVSPNQHSPRRGRCCCFSSELRALAGPLEALYRSTTTT